MDTSFDLKSTLEQQANTLFAKASTAHKKGDLQLARRLYAETLQYNSHHLKARSNFAVLLRSLGFMDAARSHFEILFSYSSAYKQDGGVLSNYGNTLLDCNRFEQALTTQQQAILLVGENNARVCFNLATALRDNGLLKEASHYFAKAKKNGYKSSLCDFNQALVELAQGNYQEGFKLFEARYQESPKHFPFLRAYPLWQGEYIREKTLLLVREQGFGDSVQFLRFIPDVARMAKKVYFVVREPLVKLVKNCMKLPDNVEIFAEEKLEKKLKADFVLPLMALGQRLAINKETISRDSNGYLVAPTQGPLITNNGHTKIGIAWCGSPTHLNDKNRSIPLTTLLPIVLKPHHDIYSLQYKQQNRSIFENNLEKTVKVPPWDKNDFHELAFVISQMDIIITVDTALVHLAGALGKPVIMFANHRPEWRWLYKDETSPWYQSLKIFHQNYTGSWQVILETFIKNSVKNSV